MSDVQVITLGCRLNTHESDVMQQLAVNAGHKNTIIVNTCAVTAEAERQARQTIRSLRKQNPEAFLIVTGCAVQMRPQNFANMPEIDRLLGNDIKLDPESFSKEFEYRAKIGDIQKTKHLTLPVIPDLQGRAKAFLQIQNGCDHRCSFCTIPLGRGKSRSVPFAMITEHIQGMLSQGIQEIVLTGVDITSYGKGLPGEMTLGKMIKRLLMQVPELKRLRLSSLDSIEMDPELLRLLCEEERLLPYVHLSLQAGHDWVLKAMKRRHTTEDAIRLCQFLKKERPELVFGADFIVGFPGETDNMFEGTLETVQSCQLTHLHVFPFSKRPGTLAEHLPDALPASVIKDRGQRLRALGQERLLKLYQTHVGRCLTILVEQPSKGHSDDFSPVFFKEPQTPHTVITATITGYDEKGLYV